jgi:hypothetical protein
MLDFVNSDQVVVRTFKVYKFMNLITITRDTALLSKSWKLNANRTESLIGKM